MDREVDNQVAAPAETRNTQLAPSEQTAPRECGWKGGDSCGDSAKRKTLSNKKQTDST
jgi:hypothetical protein